jgi:primosomal protein N' (replication factor Y)
VLLGSATPSLETLHNAYAGRYTHLRLKQRAGDARPPRVRILDVRKRPLHDGLSADVLAGIGEHLQRGQQVLVFKNRRGYAPVLLCHDCGWTAPCNRCDAPMTVHGGGRRLQCHHCGARQPAPLACPACGSLALQPQGIGTERLEDISPPPSPTSRWCASTAAPPHAATRWNSSWRNWATSPASWSARRSWPRATTCPS